MILVEHCYLLIDVSTTKILATYPSEDMANRALIRVLERHPLLKSKNLKVVRKMTNTSASRRVR